MRVVTVARKPLEGTLADTAVREGTAALNIDSCRVPVPGHTGPGRWPPNVVLLGDEVVRDLDRQSGRRKAGKPQKERGWGGIWGHGAKIPCGPSYGDEGAASRFFFVFRL